VILILILIRPLSRAPAVFIIARARPSSPSPRVDARRSNRFASRSTRCDDAGGRARVCHHHHHHHHVESS
jgi:hypothetical protein